LVCERGAGGESGADRGDRNLDECFADRWGYHLRPVFCWANRRGQDLQPGVERRSDPERHEYCCRTMSHGTGGSVSLTRGWRASGSAVSITAMPASVYPSSDWTGSDTGSYPGTNTPPRPVAP